MGMMISFKPVGLLHGAASCTTKVKYTDVFLHTLHDLPKYL